MIVINGGGIVGSYLATLLADKDDVHVIEEHAHFHKTCSALVTNTFLNEYALSKKLIKHTIYDTRIFSPNGKHIDIHFKQPDVIIHREAFIEYLSRQAEKKACSSIVLRNYAQSPQASSA